MSAVLSPVVVRFAIAAACGALLAIACGPRDDGSEQAGQACNVADECFADVADEDLALLGDLRCLDRVDGGYCTHLCETDDDCCAVEGECRSGLAQVCSPFESTGERLCFLSCEAEDLGDHDEGTYCEDFAHPAFSCRSSGGGSENRKVCVP